MQFQASQEALLEAAQCLWEAYLECELLAERKAHVSDAFKALKEYRDGYGTVELRAALRHLDILNACCEGIHLARTQNKHEEFDGAYDWDFCPWFLLNCLEVNGGHISLTVDWRTKCKEVTTEDV